MFTKMLAFEWRYFVRQPSFIVTCLVFFLLPFLAMVSDNVRIGSGGNVLFNSPYAIAQTLLIFGIFGMFLVVNFVANTAVRNQTTMMAEIIYTKPINAFQYQLGRFMGAYLVCVTVFAMVPLGVLIGSLMPWVDAERLGPNTLSFYVIPFVYFSISTLFVLATLFYAMALRFNSMMAVYVAALGLFIVFVVSGQLLTEPDQRTIAALTDPFGLRAYNDVTRYWTTFEKNNQVIAFEGLVVQNRLLWIGAGIAILLLAGRLFKPLTLSSAISKKASKKQEKVEVAPRDNNIAYQSSRINNWQQFITRASFEVKQVVFSPAFFILLIFSAFNLVAQFVDPSSLFGAPNWPLTQTMVQLINGSFSIMLVIVITYYSAEIVWRERSAGIGDIVDSMPVKNLTFWASKLVAMAVVIAAILLIGMLSAILNQLIVGFSDLNIPQYLISLFYFSGLPWLLTALLAFFIQALSPNKYVGMLIFVGYFFVSLVFNQIGLEHNMFNFAASPQLQYSDLNGYGWFLQTQNWYMLYWTGLAIVLAVVSYGVWHRGPQMALRKRFSLLGYNTGRKGQFAAALGLILFVSAGATIHYNTRVINTFYTQDEILDIRAGYEKTYIEYEDADIPSVVAVDAAIDIFPSKRKINASAQIEVINKSAEPITRFLVNLPQNSSDYAVDIEGGELGRIEPKYRTAWFEFERPMQPGERRKGVVSVTRHNTGFRDSGEDATTIKNGTFINNAELLPNFGFNQGLKITDRHERRKRDLPPPRRAYPLEDESRYGESFFGKGVELIDFKATVSTSSDQIAIAPGYLQKEWQQDGRNYYRYEMDAPMVNFFNVMSGKLAVKKEQYKGINIEVYYHPDHHWNVDRMIESTRDSLDYFSAVFGPYQHKQMRIIEFPGYRRFAQSFANTVPYSESIGFITDLRDPEEIDPVYYVTAHEVAHQWFGHQLGAANVQGSAVLSESLSQYAALMVMERKYGETKIRKFLTYELDRYLRGRSNELLEEMPMMRAENQQYIHYRKGSVVMMAIKNKLGEERLNRALRSLVEEYRFATERYPTTLDLMASLKAEADEDEQQFIDNQLSQITIYDLRASSIEAKDREDKKVEVTFKIDATQFIADGQGEESEQPLEEWVDIVLFSQDPNDFSIDNEVIYQQKHRLVSGENVLTLVVDKRPVYAGVDPYVRLIDRDSDNNIIKL